MTKKKTRITDWSGGIWYWMVEGENRSYEWTPPGFPEWQRACFSWKWQTRLKPDRCPTCEGRLTCMLAERCILVLEVRLTLNEVTGMVDDYEPVLRLPYVPRTSTWS